MLVGIDWAERHRDLCVMAADASVLARERITDGVAGVARLHEVIALWAEEPAQVMAGSRPIGACWSGRWWRARYQVVAVKPLAASRYRKRHTISRAKSGPGGYADAGRSGPHRPPSPLRGAKARKAYAGRRPHHPRLGLRQVVLAWAVGNRRLTTACHLWAFAALTGSPGARPLRRPSGRGATSHQALRAPVSRLVGILHGCLRHRRAYDEQLAWPTSTAAVAA